MAECNFREADVSADVQDSREPQRMPFARVVENILNAPAYDQEAAEQERAARAKFMAWSEFIRARGERYEGCWLKNFDQTHERQKAVVARLGGYCLAIAERIAMGDGILLYGPKGTGKDHLIVAVARAAIRAGKTVRWQNGMDLFGDIRDAIDKGDAERALVNRLVSPDVLYISDPLPPVGNLSEFQASMLFRILDGRYSRRRPTWATVNVSSGQELDSRMGPQNGDRLRDGALAIFCEWPSYRKVKG